MRAIGRRASAWQAGTGTDWQVFKYLNPALPPNRSSLKGPDPDDTPTPPGSLERDKGIAYHDEISGRSRDEYLANATARRRGSLTKNPYL